MPYIKRDADGHIIRARRPTKKEIEARRESERRERQAVEMKQRAARLNMMSPGEQVRAYRAFQQRLAELDARKRRQQEQHRHEPQDPRLWHDISDAILADEQRLARRFRRRS